MIVVSAWRIFVLVEKAKRGKSEVDFPTVIFDGYIDGLGVCESYSGQVGVINLRKWNQRSRNKESVIVTGIPVFVERLCMYRESCWARMSCCSTSLCVQSSLSFSLPGILYIAE